MRLAAVSLLTEKLTVLVWVPVCGNAFHARFCRCSRGKIGNHLLPPSELFSDGKQQTGEMVCLILIVRDALACCTEWCFSNDNGVVTQCFGACISQTKSAIYK